MLRRAFSLIYISALVFFTGEIIVRRWVYDQRPLDVPNWFVFIVLLVNSWLLLRFGRQMARPVQPTKMEKN